MKTRGNVLIIKANIITQPTKRQFGNEKKKKVMRNSVQVEWLLLPKRPILTDLLKNGIYIHYFTHQENNTVRNQKH